MKTRSNMPLFVVECEDVKALSNSQIDLLRCGDYLVKKDASGEHAYKVTFKSETGMCITYHDASVIETQSYDKVGGVWVYNSEDKTPNLLEVQNVEDAPSGTIVDALGLDASGNLVKGSAGGGTQLYKHTISTGDDFSVVTWYGNISFSLIRGYYISNEATPQTNAFQFLTYVISSNNYISQNLELGDWRLIRGDEQNFNSLFFDRQTGTIKVDGFDTVTGTIDDVVTPL